ACSRSVSLVSTATWLNPLVSIAALSSAVGVHAFRGDEHCRAPFTCHRAVVFVPIVVRPARRDEHVSQALGNLRSIETGRGSVGPDDPGRTLDRGPLPPGAGDDGRARPRAQIRDLAGAS